MFIGHYALGLYLKKKRSEVPLWLLFLCVQLVDLLWALFLLVGVERASYDTEASVFLRAVYEYYPYTHSLSAAILFGALGWFLARRFLGEKAALVVGVAIISHWFLDLVVHGPDLPLLFDSYKVGLGLWTYPLLTLLLEVAILTLAAWYFLKDVESKRLKIGIGSLYVFLTVFYIATYFAPAVAPSALQIGIFGIILYGGIPLWAYISELRTSEPKQSRDDASSF